MKVLLINGSPKKEVIYFALSTIKETLEKEGIEAEIINIGHLPIRGCIACNHCKDTGKCVFEDIVNEVAIKFKDADGLIVGSPVYYSGANGTLVNFMTRLFYSTNFNKRMKVGASVVSARRSGTTATFDELNKFFTINEMPIVSSCYWNNIHGNNMEEAKEDKEGIRIMKELAHNTAFLVKSIALGKENNLLSEREPWVGTNFIRKLDD